MPIGKVGRRGQTTIPKEVRERADLEEGDRVAFVRRGDEVILVPLRRTLLDARGSVAVSGPQDFERIRRQVIASHARRRAAGGSEEDAAGDE